MLLAFKSLSLSRSGRGGAVLWERLFAHRKRSGVELLVEYTMYARQMWHLLQRTTDILFCLMNVLSE